MRILNRPMFRYGGPINEGVMHGMRSNHANGGSIAGGHQIGTPMGNRTGFADPTFWQKLAAQYNPKNFASPKKFLKRINPFGTRKIKAGLKVAPLVTKGLKNLQGIFTRTGTSPGITGTGAGSAWMTGPAKYWGHMKKAAPLAKNLWGKHRWKTALGAPIAAPYVIDMAKKIPFSKIGDLGKGYVEKWKDVLGIESTPDEGGAGTTTPFHPSQGNLKEVIEEPVVDPDAAEKLAKAAQNKRLKSYLDMMGYDQSKKNAMSDALIDASALVQDATTEAGSIKHADWGNLINKAIQTTSKRMDKPAQIREAVGLMMTKGAIEKDIAKGKENALDQQVTTLMNNLGYDKSTATRVAKGLPKDLREQVIVDMGTSKQNLTHSSLTSSVKKWHPDAISVMDTTEVKKELGNQSAEEYITEKITDNPQKDYNNGIYIVGKEVVKVDGKGNISTIFP